MIEENQGLSGRLGSDEPTALSSASPIEPAAQSRPSGLQSADALKAGDWVIYNNYGRGVRQVAKVTPKLVKFDGNGWPRQCTREQIVAYTTTKADADLLKQAIDGVEGEYARRRSAANADYNARCKAAREAADKQLARLLGKTDASPKAAS